MTAPETIECPCCHTGKYEVRALPTVCTNRKCGVGITRGSRGGQITGSLAGKGGGDRYKPLPTGWRDGFSSSRPS